MERRWRRKKSSVVEVQVSLDRSRWLESFNNWIHRRRRRRRRHLIQHHHLVCFTSREISLRWSWILEMAWWNDWIELLCSASDSLLYRFSRLFFCALPSLQFYMSSLPCPTSRRRRRSSPASNHINYIEREIESEDFEFAAWKICKMISSRLFLLFFCCCCCAGHSIMPIISIWRQLVGGRNSHGGRDGGWATWKMEKMSTTDSDSVFFYIIYHLPESRLVPSRFLFSILRHLARSRSLLIN